MTIDWWMFDLGNLQLITTKTIPGDMTDSKDVILSETPIPGQNYSHIQYGGGGNRKLSFQLPIMNRNGAQGNVLLLKQFENLRNQSTGFFGITSSQFISNPKVLYYHGTGSVPLIYWVKKCDFTQPEGWANKYAQPQYTLIDFELWLDENNPLYLAEEIFRTFASLSNVVLSAQNQDNSMIKEFGKLL
jgi:hypothetical protein